jgi:RluA family pseudouridine synthase
MTKPARKPSLALSLLPVGVLVVLLAGSVALFGDGNSGGPNQIALMMAAVVAATIGIRLGYSWRELEAGIVHGISLSLGAVLILLVVGSLIGTWILAGIVHRLDKDTTGLMIVARNDAAREFLTEALAARNIEREYQAIAVGVMTSGGTVDAPIDRHPVDRVRMAVRTGGRDAVTHYRVIERFRRHTWVRVMLETGLTHQIRLHLAHAGYPLVGDSVYGRRLEIPRGATAALEAALRDFRRQALHAAKLTFPHPTDGRAIEVTAPLPADFLALIATLRRDRSAAEN